MEALIPILLGMLGSAVPALGASTATGAIISGIVQLAPIVIKEAPQFISQVKSLISAIKNRDDVTDDQLKQLQATEALLDAAFEKQAQADEQEDTAG